MQPLLNISYLCPMSFKPSNLGKPTPKKWVRIGNALFAAGTAGSTLAFIVDYKALSVTVFMMTVVGRGILEFFAED